MDASVRLDEDGEWWRFSGVYGEPDTNKLVKFWKLLGRLYSQSVRPWCELHDLGYQGPAFTWCNYQQEPHTVHERLDRACSNAAWSLAFPDARVHHLVSPYSDHSALHIELRPSVQWTKPKGRKRFHFEAAWLQEPDCEDMVSRSWNFPVVALGRNCLPGKIAAVETQLSAWGRMVGRATKLRIKQLEDSLVSLKVTAATADSKAREARAREELTKLITQEEVYWKQRSKDHWLKEGDRNSRFFHAKANRRFQVNSIRKLQREDGSWAVTMDEVQQCIVGYFETVFRSSRPLSDDILHGTEHIPIVVDPSMTEDLQRPFTEDEVTRALFHMSPLKSPGSDGLAPLFFQRFWHVVKIDVIACVLNFLNNRIMHVGFNDTNIVLIPKCKQPQSLSHYRPISLCNVVYKIASKTIANRLKPWLDNIISPSQSAFVPGRLITDNVLLAFETNHFLHTHSNGKKHFMNLKLDISKAYDRVEWSFLRRVMGKLGFPCSFIELVMICVTSVSYSFVLSGSQFGSLSPGRGLRQGDPLSLYLFLLCTESLSSLFRVAEERGTVPRVAVCRGAPRISHLLFADDTMVFCPASLSTVQHVRRVLDTYKLASG
ncbi:UNVERIFIED_CONTAM: putative mitochondrial protein [Sesamum latifolium]|uniref:Mitochondrial protein n=1 Tax=Sesamum latifolium TaxID=2727402 RepID=A0AAW2XV48_9LAMI